MIRINEFQRYILSQELRGKPTRHVADGLPPGGPGSGFSGIAMDAAFASGGAFVMAELEKRDPDLRMPLEETTWPRDMPVDRGGGWIEYTSIENVDFATSGGNSYGLIGGQSTDISRAQASVTKDVFPVFNWASSMNVSYADLMKSQNVGRSLDNMLDTSVHLTYDKACDLMVYLGFAGQAGLLNNANVTHGAVALGAAQSTFWINKTPLEIQYDINTLLLATLVASQYDVTGMADTILIPFAQYNLLLQPMTIGGSISILEYLLANNIAKQHGIQLKIFPSRWCKGTTNGGPADDGSIAGVGAGGTDRMVAYKNSKRHVYYDLPIPISRVMTTPNAVTISYDTAYMAQIGVVKIAYFQSVAFGDGI